MLGDAPQLRQRPAASSRSPRTCGAGAGSTISAATSRFAVRALVRSPGFSAAAILSLALATGATTAIFSIVNSVLLRPLPFAEPDRLVQVAAISQNGNPSGVNRPDLEAFREQRPRSRG